MKLGQNTDMYNEANMMNWSCIAMKKVTKYHVTKNTDMYIHHQWMEQISSMEKVTYLRNLDIYMYLTKSVYHWNVVTVKWCIPLPIWYVASIIDMVVLSGGRVLYGKGDTDIIMQTWR